MFGIRWKVATPLNQEFLQATMMLCFALSRFNEVHADTMNSGALHRRDDILEALTIAESMWEKNANRSVEAQRAAKAVTTVLKQDLDKSCAPTLTASDGERFALLFGQSTNIGRSIGLFELMPGITAQDYLGNFDYGQNMVLDPSLFVVDGDLAAFGSILDDFVAEQVEESRVEGNEAASAASNSLYSDTTI